MNYSMERLGMVYVGVEGGRIIYRRKDGDGRQVSFKSWDDVRRFISDARGHNSEFCLGCVHRFVSCGGYPVDFAICRSEVRETRKEAVA